MKSQESWADLEDRVRNSKSGSWDQVSLSPEAFLQLMDERKHFFALMCKYQCNPTGLLTVFEAIRNHLEMSQRTCNENYDWAKRVEAERDEFERKGKELCCAYGNALIKIHDLEVERDEMLKRVTRMEAPVSHDEANKLDLSVSPEHHIPLPVTMKALNAFVVARAK